MPSKTRKTRGASSTAGGRKENPALQKPLQPSKELAAMVGSDPLPRAQVVSRVWDYIKQHDLRNPENRREILADDKLKPIFGKDKVTMFEMNRYLAQHLNMPVLQPAIAGPPKKGRQTRPYRHSPDDGRFSRRRATRIRPSLSISCRSPVLETTRYLSPAGLSATAKTLPESTNVCVALEPSLKSIRALVVPDAST
jgi:upstream activation factor subunit UAF30